LRLEAVLRVLRRQVRDRWLFPNHELQLGNEVDHELTIRAERIDQGGSPAAKLLLALAQQRADKALEGLTHRRVWDVALVLVELARCEQATRRDQHLVQLVHHRGLADPGIAGDEHEFRGVLGHNSVEDRDQRVNLALPAVELLRDHQPIRSVVRAKRKWPDAAGRLPFRQTPPQIGRDARGGLVALLRGLGEELHYNRSERPRDTRDPLVERHRLPGDVAVHPLHRIGGSEGKRPRQHFVKGYTQGIEIAPGVHRAVHPASLFRRHVGERPGDHLRRRGGLVLARQTRGDAEPRQPHATACRVHQDICRFDVLMDQASLMHLAERARERDRDAQEMRYVQWPAKQSIERRTAGILNHQRHALVVARQRDGSRRPVGVKFGLERIFVFKPLDATGRAFFCGNKQDRRQAVAGAPVESDVALPQRREYVARELVHEGLLAGGLL
jgi:hypothetical protein